MKRLKRRTTRTVSIGGVRIGSGHPVAIQSMTKTKTSDVAATAAQINMLQQCGCEIVRCAVKDEADARAIAAIRKQVSLPLVADIHFNWKLALAAVEAGADKIRLNPGNIFRQREVADVVSACRSAGIPIRVGLNSGSVRGSGDVVGRMVTACLAYVKRIEGMKFRDLVISLKANNVLETVHAYRRIAGRCDYPLHLGVTATGLPFNGAIKSSIAIGALLLDGIGDTIRVSLTDQPHEEIRVAKALLESVDARTFGPRIISCPTCGRCEVDLAGIVKDLEHRLGKVRLSRPLSVAVMGCVVNGPGEAKAVDLGIAFGRSEGVLFKKGTPVRKVPARESVAVLIKEMQRME